MVKEIESFFPDDDGKKQRAWVVDGAERGTSATERVYSVLKQRPWVTGKITITEANCPDDEDGYDLFVPMNGKLLELLRRKSKDLGVPIQVKSSDHSVRDFLRMKRMLKEEKLVVVKGEYIFTFNGQKAKDLILADLVGQMLVLVGDRMGEPEMLSFLAKKMGDQDAVERWLENREVIIDSWWYKDMI